MAAALIMAFLLSWLGQVGPTKPDERSVAPAREEGATAEEILRALQRQRLPNEVLPPGSALATGTDWRKPKPRLWPEGFSLVERTGAAERRGSEWWLRFEPLGEGDTVEAMQLLPNAHLETMARMAGGAASPVRFKVSGEMTVFEGRNLLLIRSLSRASPPGEATTENRGQRPRGDASSTDVLDVLRSQTPSMAVTPTEGSEPLLGGGMPGFSDRLVPDGSPVVRRVGRLVRQGGSWLLVCDSQRGDAADAPLAVLPNQVSETMIRESQKSATPLVFIVSGEATLYFGTNYVLPRVATRRVDLGNLRP